jgi:hypothetical protein
MNCEYCVGLLVYGGHGAALRVRPDTPVPIDQFPVWFESRIDSQGVADHTSSITFIDITEFSGCLF